MSKNSKIFTLTISIFFTLVTIALSGYMFSYSSPYLPAGMICFALISLMIYGIGISKRKKFIFKLGFICSIVAAIGLGIYIALDKTGALTLLSDKDGLQNFIQKAGIWGPIVFIVIQFLQVTFVPIPSTITVIAGMFVFGNIVEVILYSTIGMVLGSMFAFFLGKTFGVKLVVWLVGEKAFNKYQKLIRGRDKTMLFLMFLLPVFPDDLLCLIAGITTMNYGTFFIMQIVARPIGIAMSSLFGELMNVLPFSGWYLAVWAGLIVAVLVMFLLVWKYSGKLEDALVKIIINKFGGKTGRTINEAELKSEVKNLVSNASVISDNDIREQNITVNDRRKEPKYFVDYY